MRLRVRPYLMAGISIVAAGSIAIPPSVAPASHPPRHENVALAASTAPVNPLLKQPPPEYATAQAATALLPASAFSSTEAMTETLDVASAQVSALALPGLENAIITAYDVIMPWVDWGVNLGIYATQWIPVVNWFTPQISIFYYSLIRPMITSAVFNIAYWVGGTISFGQGLTNFFNDTVAAGIGFVNAEIDWLLSFLPPFPPFPPFFSSLAAQSTMEVMGARTAVQIPAGVGTAAEQVIDEEPEPTTPPVDQAEQTTPPAEPETPVAGEPGPSTVETDPTDVEPQQPVQAPADDTSDGEDVGDEDTEQDADAEETTDVDSDVDSEQPDIDSEDPGPDPQADNEPDNTPDTKNETTSDTKPDTTSDTKPDSSSGSGAEK